MRTPLSSLLGATQMLLDSHLTDAQKEFTDTIADSVNGLTGIADAVAEFSGELAVRDADADLLDHQAEHNGDGAASNRATHGPARSDAPRAKLLNRGAEEMLPKAGSGTTRRSVFSAVANFSTRIPVETAKLIRILVAEDHITNQQVMLRMLTRLGFSADAVTNGIEAVAAITRSPYDIILMDCQMPELDGYEATRQIRRAGGRFKSTPIIAVTANAMAGDREKCLASGMSDYLSKPVLAQTLARTLEKWILPDAAVGAVTPPQSSPTASVSGGSAGAERSGAEAPVAKAAPPPSAPSATAEPVESAEPAVDAGALETLRSIDNGDEGFLAKIIDLFLSDLNERIEALKGAATGRDGEALKRVAHALKGSSGHFGATRLAALCRKIEQIGVSSSPADASAVVAELAAEASRVRIALEAAKAGPSSGPRIPEESE